MTRHYERHPPQCPMCGTGLGELHHLDCTASGIYRSRCELIPPRALGSKFTMGLTDEIGMARHPSIADEGPDDATVAAEFERLKADPVAFMKTVNVASPTPPHIVALRKRMSARRKVLVGMAPTEGETMGEFRRGNRNAQAAAFFLTVALGLGFLFLLSVGVSALLDIIVKVVS